MSTTPHPSISLSDHALLLKIANNPSFLATFFQAILNHPTARPRLYKLAHYLDIHTHNGNGHKKLIETLERRRRRRLGKNQLGRKGMSVLTVKGMPREEAIRLAVRVAEIMKCF